MVTSVVAVPDSWLVTRVFNSWVVYWLRCSLAAGPRLDDLEPWIDNLNFSRDLHHKIPAKCCSFEMLN